MWESNQLNWVILKHFCLYLILAYLLHYSLTQAVILGRKSNCHQSYPLDITPSINLCERNTCCYILYKKSTAALANILWCKGSKFTKLRMFFRCTPHFVNFCPPGAATTDTFQYLKNSIRKICAYSWLHYFVRRRRCDWHISISFRNFLNQKWEIWYAYTWLDLLTSLKFLCKLINN